MMGKRILFRLGILVIIVLVPYVLIFGILPVCRHSKSLDSPNIILINTDDISADIISPYGQEIIQTPHLQKMAETGTLFDYAYCAAPTCGPSRIALMLGKHLGNIDQKRNGGVIAKNETSFPELLRKRGYCTAMFGKAQNAIKFHGIPYSSLPRHDGFCEFVGFLNDVEAHQFYLDGKTSAEPQRPDHLWRDKGYGFIKKYRIDSSRYTQNEFIDLGLDFIDRHKDQSFFLYLPLQIAHWELIVPHQGEQDYHDEDYGLLEQYLDSMGVSLFQPDKDYQSESGYFTRKVKHPKATFAAMISRLDRDVGKIINKIKDLDLAKNTIIIFTADNGLAGVPGGNPFRSTGGMRGGKGSLLDGGSRVPMIFWGGGAKSQKVQNPIVHYDLGKTILDLANAYPDEFLSDGLSFKNLILEQDTTQNQRHIYLENHHSKTRQAVIWKNGLKLIKTEKDSAIYQYQLYDTHQDKKEIVNIIDSTRYNAYKTEGINIMDQYPIRAMSSYNK